MAKLEKEGNHASSMINQIKFWDTGQYPERRQLYSTCESSSIHPETEEESEEDEADGKAVDQWSLFIT